MHITCRRMLAWDCNCSYHLERKRSSQLTLFYNGSWSIHHTPIKLTAALSSPHRITPRKTLPVKSGSIVCLATIVVRGKRTPDLNSQRLKTPEEHQNFSQLVSSPKMFFLPGYSQTHTHTIIYFVRPSFQSREYKIIGVYDQAIESWNHWDEVSVSYEEAPHEH